MRGGFPEVGRLQESRINSQLKYAAGQGHLHTQFELPPDREGNGVGVFRPLNKSVTNGWLPDGSLQVE